MQIHWTRNVVILKKFSSLAAPEVVILTTSGAASDENFVKTMTFCFQYIYLLFWKQFCIWRVTKAPWSVTSCIMFSDHVWSCVNEYVFCLGPWEKCFWWVCPICYSDPAMWWNLFVNRFKICYPTRGNVVIELDHIGLKRQVIISYNYNIFICFLQLRAYLIWID